MQHKCCMHPWRWLYKVGFYLFMTRVCWLVICKYQPLWETSYFLLRKSNWQPVHAVHTFICLWLLNRIEVTFLEFDVVHWIVSESSAAGENGDWNWSWDKAFYGADVQVSLFYWWLSQKQWLLYKRCKRYLYLWLPTTFTPSGECVVKCTSKCI
jgi:hypothetical protein